MCFDQALNLLKHGCRLSLDGWHYWLAESKLSPKGIAMFAQDVGGAAFPEPIAVSCLGTDALLSDEWELAERGSQSLACSEG